jgi:hypothetical protein
MDFLKNAFPSPYLPHLVDLISAADQPLRKQLTTIARYGDLPHGHGSYFRRTREGYDALYTIFSTVYDAQYRSSHGGDHSQRFDYIRAELEKFLSHKLIRGYMISLCCILPLEE